MTIYDMNISVRLADNNSKVASQKKKINFYCYYCIMMWHFFKIKMPSVIYQCASKMISFFYSLVLLLGIQFKFFVRNMINVYDLKYIFIVHFIVCICIFALAADLFMEGRIQLLERCLR